MSDIKGQLIKNTYNYVLQSDLITGIVYRIGGDVPVNPKFISGLTINTSLTYSDGSEIDGYVLTCDASGNATWGPVSASTPSSGVTSVTATNGMSGNATTGAIILVNTAPDQIVTISGGTGITTGGTYPNFTLVNSAPDQTVIITGGTNIQILGSYPSFGVNYTGATIIQGITGITGSSGVSAITNDYGTSIVNTAPDQIVTISGGTGITTGGTYPNFTLVNSAPDRTVTITGGTNIQILGTYPDFGVNFTGTTGSNFTGGTVSGPTNFTDGLTANTISATTYYNLPISAVTNGTGISASTSNGNVTITNTAPDQTVLISGGSNIQITGSYPSFGVNFTGSTSSTGDYLPLSGGTVTGGTTFQSGLTANTISATTYYNYPDTYVTGFSLTNDVITLSQNRTDSYSSFTVTLSGLTGTPQQIAYYNTSGNLTGDTNFTRLDETNNFTTGINTVNFSNVAEHQDSKFDYNIVRDRVYNDDVALVAETNQTPTGYFNIINNTTGNTFSGLDILETAGTFRYTYSAGTYCGFFYNTTNPGWSIVRTGTQYDYNLPQSAYVAGSVLTDVSGDGNLTWVVPTNTSFTGGTVSGATRFISGLTANTISATTYQNLPSFTGGTVSGATRFISGLTANTISATTYQNLPATPFLPLTGGTVSGNVRIQPTPSVNGKPLFSISENSSESIAFYGLAGKGTNAYGVYCDVSPAAEFYTITNGIGGYFEVGGQFGEGDPTNKYSLQLKDGTEGLNKVLTSVTSDGKSNWSDTLNVSSITSTTITSNSVKVLPVALTVISNTASTNASLSSLFTLTLTGNTTLATPTNGFSGQRIVYRLRQDGTGNKLLTLSSGFRSGPITVTLSTAANTTDYLGVIYNEFDNVWDVLALNKGYS